MNQNHKLRVAVLASGRGSNLQALIDSCRSGEVDARVILVISDNPAARALELARKNSIPATVIEAKGYHSRHEFNTALADAVERSGADLVCLAGFMRVLSEAFLERFNGMIINIHPSLLPSFPGLNAQKQALEHGVKVTGCTVHWVDRGVDTGSIILQDCVKVEPDDTVETLSQRILKQEHVIYPKAVQLIASGAVKAPVR